MEEEKERLLAVFQNPGLRVLQRLPARALVLARRARRRDGDRVFVELEAVIDPGVGAQNVGRHRGARCIASLAQLLGESSEPRSIESVADVVPHAVLGGQQPGEHRDVRRKRHRAMAVDALEEDRVAPQSVDVGCFDLAVTVGREVVRTQGIDRDEDHRRAREASGGGVAPAGGRQKRGRDHRATERATETHGVARITSARIPPSVERIPGSSSTIRIRSDMARKLA